MRMLSVIIRPVTSCVCIRNDLRTKILCDPVGKLDSPLILRFLVKKYLVFKGLGPKHFETSGDD